MKRLLAVVVFIFFAHLLSACDGDCEPEGERELCGERGCGVAFLVDSCGERREVDCGGCGENEDCQENQCICTREEDQELCDGADAVCGWLVVADRCGEERHVRCGECAEPGECIENQCICEGESEEELCELAAFECGEADVRDRCGEWRTVECGVCTGEREQCVENLCRCDGESDTELCSSQAKECGEVMLVDACGESRPVDCGFCAGMGEECIDHQCICEAESDQVLCDSQVGLCGEQEFVDRCGTTRNIQCEPCAVGNALFGAVRNAETGELIEDALIRVYEFPPPGGASATWEWPLNHRANDPDFGMSSRHRNEALSEQINYEFGTQGSICLPTGEVQSLVKDQWYRIRVDRSGYQPGFFYYQHTGYGTQNCPATCLPSSESRCRRLDFELWPDDVRRPLLPDLWIDVRALNDNMWQCAIMPDGHPFDRIIAFRITSGIANIGPGPFHLEGVEGGPNDDKGLVMQNIYWSDNTVEARQIESEFFDYYHKLGDATFLAWVRLGLVDPREECKDVEDRPANCVSHESEKISFCLHDSDRFDRDIMAAYNGSTARFTNPPACHGKEQGITPGWKDTYGYTLPDQVVVIGPPQRAATLGEKWVEMEIDPRKVLSQTSRAGTVARLLVNITEEADGLCNDPNTTIDCTVPREQYSTEQRWFCPNYLRYEE